MRLTIHFTDAATGKPKKINVRMLDDFNKATRTNDAARIVRTRFPELKNVSKTYEFTIDGEH